MSNNNNNLISIRHFVTGSSTQWVIGRNIIRACNINHIGMQAFVLPGLSPPDSIFMLDLECHNCMRINRFRTSTSPPGVTCLPEASWTLHMEKLDDWTKLQRVADRIKKHVCGHPPYSHMRTLQVSVMLSNEQTEEYLRWIVTDCRDYRSSSIPPPNPRVSFSSSSRQFKEIVCVEHMFLGYVTIFHCMEVASRLSAGHVLTTTKLF